MNEPDGPVARHYAGSAETSALVRNVSDMLAALPPGRLAPAQLAALDQFHLRGMAATAELAQLAGIGPAMRVLDAGSGFGGPARDLAATYGCTVDAVDLTPAFVAVARLLTDRAELSDLVTLHVGDIAAMPFSDATFDVVWTQHAVMNVPDRGRAYAEFRRVLKPGGKVAFYDVIAAGGKGEAAYPVPWATTNATSFLLTREETLAALSGASLSLEVWNDVTATSLEWLAGQQSRPAAQGPSLAAVVGPRFAGMTANFARNLREGRMRVAMGIAVAG